MKKLLHLLLLTAVAAVLPSCNDDDENDTNLWERYAAYREANAAWVNTCEARTNPDGTKYYERLQPGWDPEDFILIHFFNDRNATAGNLRPLLTSTVSARYIGRNYRGQIFDADSTSADGTAFAVQGVIPGWQTALQYMHVGDTVEIILPYKQAYGSQGPNDLIAPYSALQFNMRLTSVNTLEVRP